MGTKRKSDPLNPTIPKGRKKYQLRKCVGIKKHLNGNITPMRFYLGHDEEMARQKVIRINADWATLKAAGHQWWTEEAIARLVAEGVINKEPIRGTDAARLIGEPLNSAELAPYIDPANGLIRPELAPAAIDYGAKKVFGRSDIRSRLFEQLYAEALKDPLSTFARCLQMFGWSQKETAQMLFQVNGTMAMNPIGFDASEGTKQVNGALGELFEQESTPDSDSRSGEDKA